MNVLPWMVVRSREVPMYRDDPCTRGDAGRFFPDRNKYVPGSISSVSIMSSPPSSVMRRGQSTQRYGGYDFVPSQAGNMSHQLFHGDRG